MRTASRQGQPSVESQDPSNGSAGVFVVVAVMGDQLHPGGLVK